jgi:hypothetical protein
MPDNGAPVEFELVFETDGTVTDPWWSKNSYAFTKNMGCTPLEEYRDVAANPYCG